MSVPKPQTSPASLSRGYFVALTGILIWSTTGVLLRYINQHYSFPPLLLAFWRDLFAFILMALGLLVIRRSLLRVPRRQWRFMLLYGILMSLFNGFWIISVALNGAAVSTLLVYSSAAITAIVAWPLFGEILTLPKTIAVVLSLFGCVLVAGAHDPAVWQSNPAGILVGFASGLGLTGYSLMGTEASRRGISSWTALMYTFGIAAALLLVYDLAFPQIGGMQVGSRDLIPDVDLTAWALVLLNAAVPSIGGYGLYTLALTMMPTSIVNLLATLEPSLTAVQAYILLKERFTLPQIMGSLLIIAGMVVLRWMESPPKKTRYISPIHSQELNKPFNPEKRDISG